MSDGYVYFAQDGDRVKIGYSQYPTRRMDTPRAKHPEIKLLGAISGDFDDEASYHKRFRHLCCGPGREWFSLTDELIAFVASLDQEEISREIRGLTVFIPEDLHRDLKQHSIDTGSTVRQIVISALRKHLPKRSQS